MSKQIKECLLEVFTVYEPDMQGLPKKYLVRQDSIMLVEYNTLKRIGGYSQDQREVLWYCFINLLGQDYIRERLQVPHLKAEQRKKKQKEKKPKQKEQIENKYHNIVQLEKNTTPTICSSPVKEFEFIPKKGKTQFYLIEDQTRDVGLAYAEELISKMNTIKNTAHSLIEGLERIQLRFSHKKWEMRQVAIGLLFSAPRMVFTDFSSIYVFKGVNYSREERGQWNFKMNPGRKKTDGYKHNRQYSQSPQDGYFSSYMNYGYRGNPQQRFEEKQNISHKQKEFNISRTKSPSKILQTIHKRDQSNIKYRNQKKRNNIESPLRFQTPKPQQKLTRASPGYIQHPKHQRRATMESPSYKTPTYTKKSVLSPEQKASVQNNHKSHQISFKHKRTSIISRPQKEPFQVLRSPDAHIPTVRVQKKNIDQQIANIYTLSLQKYLEASQNTVEALHRALTDLPNNQNWVVTSFATHSLLPKNYMLFSVDSSQFILSQEMNSSKISHIGLADLGYCGYQNSVFQCLAHSRQFIDILLKTVRSQTVISADKSFSRMLKDIFQGILTGRKPSKPLAAIRNYIGNISAQWVNGAVQDPVMFLQFLLQELSKDPGLQKALSLFYGVRQVKTEFSCGKQFETSEKFGIIPIQTLSSQPFQYLQKISKQSVQDRVKCPSHARKQNCSKSFFIRAFPKILIMTYQKGAKIDLRQINNLKIHGKQFYLSSVVMVRKTYSAICKINSEWYVFTNQTVQALKNPIIENSLILFFQQVV